MRQGKNDPSGKKHISRVAGAFLASAVMASSFGLSSCGRKPDPTTIPVETEDTRATESIAQVGTVPAEFEKIISEDKFRNVKAFSDRLLELKKSTEENNANAFTITMMDLYGEVLTEYSGETENDAYGATTLTATSDGGFIFAQGYNANYIPGMDQIKTGYHSRIIKCDAKGNVVFDTKLDSVTIGALDFCIEKDGRYYFFGADKEKEGDNDLGKPKVSCMVFDGSGKLEKQLLIGGSSHDHLIQAESTENGFLLEINSMSEDGDFEGSGANYHEIGWKVTISDDLVITEKEKLAERTRLRTRVGEKDGKPVYMDDKMFDGFDAGGVMSYIDYGDKYLLVSYHPTGEYEKQPAYISSIWQYSETVYSMYDRSGKLLFRASVDSSPDYDAIVSSEKEL